MLALRSEVSTCTYCPSTLYCIDMLCILYVSTEIWCVNMYPLQGRIQDFKTEEIHLKKLSRAEGGTNFFGVFRVKNHDFTPKNIFSNFRIRPCTVHLLSTVFICYVFYMLVLRSEVSTCTHCPSTLYCIDMLCILYVSTEIWSVNMYPLSIYSLLYWYVMYSIC